MSRPGLPALSRDTAFLFDFDGTIADSTALHDRSFRSVLETGRPDLLAVFDYDAVRGIETAQVFRMLGFSPEEAAANATGKRRIYAELLKAGLLTFMPHAEQCLQGLAHIGAPLYLATSGSRVSVTEALRALGLGQVFRGIVTASDVARGKPAPDIFDKLVQDYGIDRRRAVVIEDAPSGVEAARSAGLPVIGVYNRELEQLADLYLATLEGLLPLIGGVGVSTTPKRLPCGTSAR